MFYKIYKKVFLISGILGMFLFFLNGCSTVPIKPTENTPISSKHYRIKYYAYNYIVMGKVDPNIFPKITSGMKFEDQVKIASPLGNNVKILRIPIKKYKINKFIESNVMEYYKHDLNNNILKSDGSYSCNYLKKILYNIFKSSFKVPVTIVKHDGATCSWNNSEVKCGMSRSYYLRKTLNNGALMIDHVFPFYWEGYNVITHRYFKDEAYGFAEFDFSMHFLGCHKKEDYTVAVYDVTPKNIYIKNASSLFQTIGSLKVRWPDLENELKNMEFYDSLDLLNKSIIYNFGKERPIYASKLSKMVSHIRAKLRKRLQFSRECVLKKEKIYDLSPTVFKSRVQRALKFYKFNRDKSLFVFKGKEVLLNETFLDYNKRAIILSLSVFPETNHRAAVVYNFSYYPIFDDLSHKKIFTEQEANRLLNSYIKIIDKVVGNSLL